MHLYDRDDLKLQTVHSIISGQLQELKDRGILSQGHQLQVRMGRYQKFIIDRKLILSLMYSQGSVIVDSILASALSDADIVLEAVNIEDVQVKNRLFKGT